MEILSAASAHDQGWFESMFNIFKKKTATKAPSRQGCLPPIAPEQLDHVIHAMRVSGELDQLTKEQVTNILYAMRMSGHINQSDVVDADSKAKYQMSVAEWMKREHEQIILGFQVSWMGIRILKNPLDCWIYQELIWKVRPEVVIEIGSYQGGSTMFFCHLFDMMGQGQVISLDIDRSSYQAKHPRITDITGDCSDSAIVGEVTQLCAGKKVMVIHDGDHAHKAVLRDLRLYADIVSLNSYFIVEDGIVDVFDAAFAPTFGNNAPGPLPAIREFLHEDARFAIDKDCERYLITHNPCGFLKRVHT